MGKAIDLTGQRFGRLLVIERSMSDDDKQTWWRCQCECGATKMVRSKLLRDGITQSCGCLARELASQRRTVHGMTLTPTYKSWRSMHHRCKHSPAYIKKGIGVCGEWRDFDVFLRDLGEREPGTTLGRIDNTKGYYPGNCRWETPTQQNNNRSSTIFIELNGIRRSLMEWSRITGTKPATIKARLDKGWSCERALSASQAAEAQTRMIADRDVIAKSRAYLAESVKDLGVAAENAARARHAVGTVEAILKLRHIHLGIERAEIEALTSDEYRMALEEDAKTAARLEELRSLREAAAMDCELWRTEQASLRGLK